MIDLLSYFKQILVVLGALDHLMKSLLLRDILNCGGKCLTLLLLCCKLCFQDFVDLRRYLLSVSHAENIVTEDL